jgi:hypothetical protein
MRLLFSIIHGIISMILAPLREHQTGLDRKSDNFIIKVVSFGFTCMIIVISLIALAAILGG